jgi:hypothetical protein
MKISQQVENILASSRQARNSDKSLLLIYMQKSGMNLTPRQVSIFLEMPSRETLRRVRQKIQERGQYTADSSVKKVRDYKSLVVSQNAPTASPKTIERIIEEQPHAVQVGLEFK